MAGIEGVPHLHFLTSPSHLTPTSGQFFATAAVSLECAHPDGSLYNAPVTISTQSATSISVTWPYASGTQQVRLNSVFAQPLRSPRQALAGCSSAQLRSAPSAQLRSSQLMSTHVNSRSFQLSNQLSCSTRNKNNSSQLSQGALPTPVQLSSHLSLRSHPTF